MSSPCADNPGTDPDAVHVGVPYDRDRIDELEERLLEAVERAGYEKASRFAIKLAFEEALMNAFSHGHEGLGDDVEVEVEYRVRPDEVFIAVQDQGPGFTPHEVPDPTLDENLAKPTGRGLMLIRAYMSEVTHNAAGNRVEMRYRRPAD
ncbi:MAG: ATP-binding protein [Phycisphaerales bacterium]